MGLCKVAVRKGHWKLFPSQEDEDFKKQISAKKGLFEFSERLGGGHF